MLQSRSAKAKFAVLLSDAEAIQGSGEPVAIQGREKRWQSRHVGRSGRGDAPDSNLLLGGVRDSRPTRADRVRQIVRTPSQAWLGNNLAGAKAMTLQPSKRAGNGAKCEALNVK